MSTLPPPPPYGSSSAAHNQLLTSSSSSGRTVVEVVAKRGGLAQAILFVVGIGLLCGAFVVGIVFGAAAALAPSAASGLPLENLTRAGDADNRVAIINVRGPIDDQTSEEVSRAVAYVLEDSSFRSVVLRVDSPGGAVSPSDRIWRDIERLKEKNVPVVASYGGIAASGGVYVSCGADSIVCEPTAITGSVGVIASVLTFGDLMDKVGVKPETIIAQGSPRKDDANDIYRAWDATDKAVVQGMLDRSYETFVKRVMDGRSTKVTDVATLRSALDGRVVGAEEAKSLGLVDSIGYLDDAIVEAERLAQIPPGSASVVELFEPVPFFGNSPFGLMRRAHASQALDRIGAILSSGGSDRSALVPQRSESDAEVLRSILQEFTTPRIEYRIVY